MNENVRNSIESPFSGDTLISPIPTPDEKEVNSTTESNSPERREYPIPDSLPSAELVKSYLTIVNKCKVTLDKMEKGNKSQSEKDSQENCLTEEIKKSEQLAKHFPQFTTEGPKKKPSFILERVTTKAKS